MHTHNNNDNTLNPMTRTRVLTVSSLHSTTLVQLGLRMSLCGCSTQQSGCEGGPDYCRLCESSTSRSPTVLAGCCLMKAVFQSPQLQDLGTELVVLGIAQKLLQVFLRVNENSSRHVTQNDTHSENCFPALSK